MRVRAAVNRADLLLVLREAGSHGVELAAACGFVPLPPKEEKKTVPALPEIPRGNDEPRADPEIEKQPLPEVVRRRFAPLEFLVPVKREDKELPPERVREDLPPGISDAELALRKVSPLPLRPLAKWARLGAFLRRVGGRMVPGAAVDQERLARQAARGLPLVRIPRVARRVWARELLVLRDETREMYPFSEDGDWLLRRLRRERGKSGLKVKRVLGRPDLALLAGVPRDVPVVAMSAMGQHHGGQSTQAAWVALGELAKRRGHPVCGLVPVPRAFWRDELAAAWPLAVWDHGVRLPREVRRRSPLPQRAAGSTEVPAAADSAGESGAVGDGNVESLLDLVSPATFVEAPLLRAVRLRLPGADARTEWLAWHDANHWLSQYSFGFVNPERAGEAGARYAERLERRRLRSADELADVDALLARHHAPHSVAIAEEARLRAILSGPDQGQQKAELQEFLTQVLNRLRVLATAPESVEVEKSGLAAWFLRMIGRLPAAMLSDPGVADLLARSLAVAHVSLGQQEAELPRGIEPRAYGMEWAAAGQRRREPVSYRLDLIGNQSSARWMLVPPLHGILGARPTAPAGTRMDTGMMPGRSSSAESAMLSLPVELAGEGLVVSHGGAGRLNKLSGGDEVLEIPVPDPPVAVVIDTGRTRLTIEPRRRPRWAARMEYGHDGITAYLDAERSLPPIHWRWSEPARQPASSSSSPDRAAGIERHGLWVPAGDLPWGRLSVDEFGPLATFVIRGVEFRLRWIPQGTFLMGSPEDENGRQETEGPQHEVRISRGFWMGDTPVTQAQWQAVVAAARESAPEVWRALRKEERMEEAPSRIGDRPDHPVESVSWHQSDAFCRLLRAVLPQGPDFRLPSEAQWEYACRADSQGAFCDGSPCTQPEGMDPALDRLGWFHGNSGRETHAVRQKQPNAWGLYDLHGNVWEWCRDAWDEGAYRKREAGAVDPEVPSEKSAERVVRGGSWLYLAWFCRAAIRNRLDPVGVWFNIGLRLSAGHELGAAEPPGDVSGTLTSSRVPAEPPAPGAEGPGFISRIFGKRRRK
jgi:formylglycine-generating enzyme required for sulfatase activity